MASPTKKGGLTEVAYRLEKNEEKAKILQEIFRRIMFFPFMVQLFQLCELRKAFNLMKKRPVGDWEEHLNFQVNLVSNLEVVSCLEAFSYLEATTDDICNWIEIEYAKLVPRGELYKFPFIQALFSAVIHCSINCKGSNLVHLNESVFRRWAQILHRYTTDHSVEASQILLFVAQDYAATLKYHRGMLFHILAVLYENTNFLSYVEDRNDWIKSKSLDNMPDTVVFCLLLNAQRFPEV